MKTKTSRRGFLKRATNLASTAVAVPMVVRGAVLGKDGNAVPSERVTLGMIGVAGKIKGDDGDHALLVDVIGQYNWQAGDINGFAGLGLGGWITFGDGDNDSEDTDLDLIANVGARVYGEPNDFNTSVFLEVRSAIDEIDDLTDYGRFGAGVRFQF